MENSITITRKYTLYPEPSERKEWTKKVTEFIVNSYNQKIEYYNAKLDKAKTKKEKSETEERINNLLVKKQNFEETKVITNEQINHINDLLDVIIESKEQCKK